MRIIIVIFLCLSAYCTLNAQVTIGTNTPPIEGAILQLKENENSDINAKKGLLLPRVELQSLTGDLAKTLDPSVTQDNTYDPIKHIGLTVYNTSRNETDDSTRRCPGVHAWDGTSWVPLQAYPEVRDDTLAHQLTDGELIYLENVTDPKWFTYLNINKNGYPVTEKGTFTDTRETPVITYNTQRFYAGVYKLVQRYRVDRHLSCDPDGPTTRKDKYKVTITFNDGVWMTQNLQAKTYDIQRDNPKETLVPISNWQPANGIIDESTAYWIYPDNNNSAADATKTGLYYTWPAVTNGKDRDGKILEFEASITEGDEVQGICPAGWHVPSDREWTDLENSIINMTSKYANASDIKMPIRYIYDYKDPLHHNRGSHGNAMKNPSLATGVSYPYNGATQRGFDGYPTGLYVTYQNNSNVDLIQVQGTELSTWWTASRTDIRSADNNLLQSQRRVLTKDLITVGNIPAERSVLHPVRCKTNTKSATYKLYEWYDAPQNWP